MFESRRRFAIR